MYIPDMYTRNASRVCGMAPQRYDTNLASAAPVLQPGMAVLSASRPVGQPVRRPNIWPALAQYVVAIPVAK